MIRVYVNNLAWILRLFLGNVFCVCWKQCREPSIVGMKIMYTKANILWLTYTFAHFFVFSGTCCKLTFGWNCGLLKDHNNPKSVIWNKIRLIIFFQIAILWLTDILSISFSRGNRKIKLTAKKKHAILSLQMNQFVHKNTLTTQSRMSV